MKIILAIVRNDLRRRVRRPLAVLLMMLIPVVITLVIGLVFGSSGESGIPRATVLIVDRDGGIAARVLSQAFREGQLADMIELVDVAGDEGEKRMAAGKASALVEIPEGFTEAFLDRRPVEIRLVRNPAESFLPIIAEEAFDVTTLVLDGAGRVFGKEIAMARGIFDGGAWPARGEIDDLLESARARLVLAASWIGDSLLAFEETTIEPESQEEESGINLFAYILPGSLLIGLLFISEIAMRDLFREGQTGTLRRLFAGPVEPGEYVAAKIASTALLTALACAILLAVGRFGFRFPLGDPLALGLVFATSVLMCAGVTTFFYGIIRTERAADAVMSIVIIALCLLGGSMIPSNQMGSTLRAAAPFSPVYWAVEGFRRVFVMHAGAGDIALNAAILFAVAAGTAMPGALLLRHRVRRGE